MSKIDSFTKDNLGNIRAALATALANVEKEFGIKIKVGGIKFTSDSFKAELGAMTGGDDPILDGVDPKYVQEIKRFRNTADLFMKSTNIDGTSCVIVGIKPRTRLESVLVRRASDNSLRIVSMELVQAGLVK